MLKNFQFRNSQRICVCLLIILSFGFSTTLIGNETVERYYPVAPGSHWTYEDQDGQELTRYALRDREESGVTYHNFQYDPALSDPGFYLYQIHPYRYNVNENGIAYFVGNRGKFAIQRTRSKLMEIAVPSIREGLRKRFPKSVFKFSYTVDVDMSEIFQLLPASIRRNKKWEAMKTEVTMTLTTKERKKGEKPEKTVFTNHATFEETGTLKGTETVKTPAGTFEDCLKIVFENKEVASRSAKHKKGGFELSHGKLFTTIWLARDVGIVKWEYDAEDTKSKSVFALTAYEIKPALSRGE